MLTSTSPPLPVSATASLIIGVSSVADVAPSTASNKKLVSNLEQSVQPESQLNLDGDNNAMRGDGSDQKTEIKPPLAEELQPSLDSGKIHSSSETRNIVFPSYV